MRMSDWSADVCSSDLHPCNCRPMLFGLRPIPKENPGKHILSKSFTENLPQTPRIRLQTGGRTWPVFHFGSLNPMAAKRSEERRVGKECVSTCRSRWSPYH